MHLFLCIAFPFVTTCLKSNYTSNFLLQMQIEKQFIFRTILTLVPVIAGASSLSFSLHWHPPPRMHQVFCSFSNKVHATSLVIILIMHFLKPLSLFIEWECYIYFCPSTADNRLSSCPKSTHSSYSTLVVNVFGLYWEHHLNPRLPQKPGTERQNPGTELAVIHA